MNPGRKERILSALPPALLMLVAILWGMLVWIPDSAGYELVLHQPTAVLIVVTAAMTAMLVPLAVSRGKTDRIGGICASFLPLATVIAGILFLDRMGCGAPWSLVWLAIWSIIAAIRHGSKKGWRTFGCVIAGICALCGLIMLAVYVNVPDIVRTIEGTVVRSAASPDGTLIAEEIGHGDEDSSVHIVQVRETGGIDVLIGTLQRPARALHNPFYGSGAIEGLEWADEDTVALSIKGREAPVLIDVGPVE